MLKLARAASNGSGANPRRSTLALVQFPYFIEHSALVNAPISTVFDYVDDPARLAGHMSQSSWRLGGGKMSFEFDDGRGRAVGSRVRLSGRILGVPLFLEEIVTDRTAPMRKAWETCGEPRLLVIGPYRMGFELTQSGRATTMRVFLAYDLAPGCVSRWLSKMFARYFADWCTRRMVSDTVAHFTHAARALDVDQKPLTCSR